MNEDRYLGPSTVLGETSKFQWRVLIMKQAAIFLQLTTLIYFLGYTYGGTINVPADYTTIQAGIDAAATGDTVLVAAGTYNEDILLKSGVLLQGAGNEVTTIQGTGTEAVVTAWEVDEYAGINGFTITGGNGASGGGIYCYNSSPIISSNVLTGNIAPYGGGIHCLLSNPTITNNVITGNRASYGGAIGVQVHSSPTIIDNIISGNNAGNYGGGIISTESNARISNNVITGNSATTGGGVYCSGWDSSRVTNNVIASNSADNGGGISCAYFTSPKIIGNVIAGNSAGVGGGISLGIACQATIANNVIADNRATDYGGGIVEQDNANSFPTIINCIVWGNGDDLYDCEATYSCIEDGDPGEGNIALDPLFVDAANVDYRLQFGSPCIDFGSIIPELPAEDLDGNPRIADGDGNGIAIVDMGAYEYVIPVLAVLIDIKPGSAKNPINLRSRGVVPVALLSSPNFDASLVDLGSVTFGPNLASPVHISSKDVDHDGTIDILFHFRLRETGIARGDTCATLKGMTGDGTQVISEDHIRVVPTKK